MEDRTVSTGERSKSLLTFISWNLLESSNCLCQRTVPDAMKLQWPLVSLNTYSYDGKDGIWKVELQSHLLLQRGEWLIHVLTRQMSGKILHLILQKKKDREKSLAFLPEVSVVAPLKFASVLLIWMYPQIATCKYRGDQRHYHCHRRL